MTARFTLELWGRVLDRLGLIPGSEEVPGGDGDEDAAASGMVLLESDTISSPHDAWDIDLPSGYILFIGYFAGVACDANNLLIGGVSTDGGVSFISDDDNFDTYCTNIWGIHGVSADNSSGSDAIFYLGSDSEDIRSAEDVKADFILVITPGDATSSFKINTDVAGGYDSGDGLIQVKNEICFNHNAAAPPTLARINAIRIAPGGNFDINPPTSARRIVRGSYSLYGVPAP